VLNLGHILVIDTYCYGDQWLTALDVESGKIWQANNQGKVRTSHVDDLDSPEKNTDDNIPEDVSSE